MGATFFLGAMGAIGFGFVPIIDKQDMIYLPIVYMAFSFILLKFISISMSYVFEFAKYFFRITTFHKLTAIPSVIISLYVLYTYILKDFLEAKSPSVEEFTNIIETLNNASISRVTLYFVLAIPSMFTMKYFIHKFREIIKNNDIGDSNYHYDMVGRLDKLLTSGLPILFFGLSISLGVLWIEFLQLKEPNLRIVFSDNNTANANAVVVLRANEGIIAYLDNDTLARYIPWHAVKQIISIEKKNELGIAH